jgi:putative ABC transport system substrate-binding protein
MAGALPTVPFVVDAQQMSRVPRIGYLLLNSAERSPQLHATFWQELRARGWVEGRNIVVEVRSADGRVDRLPALVAELIRLKVDLIVTTSSGTTWAVKDATKSIPVVMTASADAVGEGLVTNLAHPSGNITGMTFLAGPEIATKQLQLLREMAPAASRVVVLANPTNRAHAPFVRELKVTARTLGAQLQVVEAANLDQLDRAFAALTAERAEALLVLTDSMLVGERRRVTELAARSNLPALYSQREFVVDGGLVSYGPSLMDMFRRAALHVDKILRGASPSDLPIEQPTKFELVINLKTAKELGITIPQALLLRADEVIK